MDKAEIISLISSLKQSNISENTEKTKTRLREIWRQTPSNEREDIINTASVVKTTVERSYKTGSISAKLAMAAAYVLNVNPHYLTGESDENEQPTEKQIAQFLRKLGYEDAIARPISLRFRGRKAKNTVITNELEDSLDDNIVGAVDNETESNPDSVSLPSEIETKTESPERKIKRPYNRKPETEQQPQIDVADMLKKLFDGISEAQIAFAQSLSHADMELLLKSLEIRSKSGGDNELIYGIVRLLLSL